jgi:hypothetical protein
MELTYYLYYDLPVPYKKIKIYPVTVKDYLLFNAYSSCLLLDKNSIPDVKAISMNNLEYIFYCAYKENKKEEYLVSLDRILSMCLKEDKTFENINESIKRYRRDEKTGKPFFVIEEERYLSEDFEEIKKIICQQNLVEIPDETISKEVRDSLEKARKYKEKLSGNKTGSFEDYIVSLSMATGWQLEYIYSMPVRKFIKAIRRMDNFIHYKIFLAASLSGMVEFKDKSVIKHWLSDIENDDKYKDVSVDLDTMSDKISLESAKAK